ncbi:peptidase domain-containing ABC transporter [Fulvivirga maritima]|uniref:peptidase domain-containing ABC transporter n=1 Tax=Fulvivirga maritima TaxID=2904247 RepID=UPI001F249E10|nr:peptidase domain-containing ABC transporter [Fulvivirga maritima]UII26786.1 peptidase domain-containing ABC transporter [Fulvivirga maritima]
MKFPFVRQLDVMDCGAACLSMVAKYHGRSVPLQKLRQMSDIDRDGASLAGIMQAAEKIHFRSFAAYLTEEQLVKAPLPIIIHWDQVHYVILYKTKNQHFYIADPGKGKVKLKRDSFMKHWKITEKDSGVALLLEPLPSFYKQPYNQEKNNIGSLFHYLRGYKKLFTQVFLGLFLATLLGMALPFLTQAIVDTGIQTENLNFIYLICLAQLMVFSGRMVVEMIRTRVLLHIGSRLSISLLADFLEKLMALPASFFDARKTADIMQRMQDHKRIEIFFTKSVIAAIFSSINLIVFSIVLVIYSFKIALIFFIGTILSTIWIFGFMSRRKQVDYGKFLQQSENQNALIEIVQGMFEIKLNGAEKEKSWDWQEKQARLFKLNFSSLNIEQSQQGGTLFLGEIKNILIIAVSASLVLKGELTLGMMLSISYITGQLNNPVVQFIDFFRNWQDAQISFKRINEIFLMETEDREKPSLADFNSISNSSLSVSNITFKYNKAQNKAALRNISLNIPSGKVTAIVGASGSGKTTLIKLLLKFIEPDNGSIHLGNIPLAGITASSWRKKCGAVLQGGYIFSDTVANNITFGSDLVDHARLQKAAQLANVDSFISSLPSGYQSVIGIDGIGLSEGQKQRILIARAAYRDPEFIFFDEATNSLDANNEKEITENLSDFFKGKTVVIVAHRLSTVRHADQIIMLDKGHIIEQGSHDDLIRLEGGYYHLIKNQLELGL